MSTTHTPIPWKITGPFQQNHRLAHIHIKCSRGEDDVAIIGYDITRSEDRQQAFADGDLIVRAVNAHADLLEFALAHQLSSDRDAYKSHYNLSERDSNAAHLASIREAAIARAKGGAS